MATPHATGIVALLAEAFPALTPAELKERMMVTAINLGLDANTQGRGRADAYGAYVGTPTPGPTPTPTPPPTGCLLSILHLFAPRQ
jgi:subtilisin family serine protease